MGQTKKRRRTSVVLSRQKRDDFLGQFVALDLNIPADKHYKLP